MLKKLIALLASLIVVFFLVFIILTQILGVPLWWVFRNIVPLSGVSISSKFDVTVNPDVPTTIGESITVTVRNMTSEIPVENATVSVYKDSGFINDYYTDNNGETSITYVGEVTVIKVNKEGFDGTVEAIPQVPDKYVRDQNNAIIGGLVSGISSSILIVVLQQRLAKRKPIRKKRNIRVSGFNYLKILVYRNLVAYMFASFSSSRVGTSKPFVSIRW
jgi:hypothetical protein